MVSKIIWAFLGSGRWTVECCDCYDYDEYSGENGYEASPCKQSDVVEFAYRGRELSNELACYKLKLVESLRAESYIKSREGTVCFEVSQLLSSQIEVDFSL